jgi:hypothetical protein
MFASGRWPALWQANIPTWVVLTAFANLSLAANILLLAALVLVPLGRQLLRATTAEPTLLISRMADRLQATAGWLLAVACCQHAGWFAAFLATPWFVFTLLCATEGAWRIWRTPLAIGASFARHSALVLLAIGGSWTVVSRAGARPLDFSDAIVLLTAVHFHYAGFVLPLLTARVVEFSDRRAPLLIACVVIGVPLVGVGITFSPLVEVVAAGVLALACIVVSFGQLNLTKHVRSGNELALLLVSSASLFAAMLLALVYALGEFWQQPWLSIETMVATHGLANSLGFSACGLLAWRAATLDSPPARAGGNTSGRERRSRQPIPHRR